MSPKILITGANGQIGRVLTEALRQKFGRENVLATDITKIEDNEPFEFLDILNSQRLYEIVEDHNVTQIYHLAAILSASGEWNPLKTWNINLNGLLTVLELVREKKLDKVFFPSTIAVFGNTTPRVETPQDVPLLPSTVYGMSKSSGELWCLYYYNKFGVDVRSLRYPGIIGWQSLPAGGTTDYAVEIYHAALKNKHYECFLNADTRLPMMYMDDAIKATIDLMEADGNRLTVRYGYNLAAMSFSPEEIFQEIKKHIPEFTIDYKPDFRENIARSWTESIDDRVARKDWDWNPGFNLKTMSEDMLHHLKIVFSQEK
ncbi:MAG: NAD-dependent epimerase/dehydratase family protein [Saprospiraceae bacterium]|nr:NAD-dependent epimerase/dehydratase family protein [Saprospiraceae bacterium]MBK6566356.1 NAD-dependent epimerase/dehydratase family protein [Saprospiraceae bacterium]MBK7524279.1 NAD-dependent epimerase/dehydratase family protein [Saprospiraceae bacterium]MBK8080803.1 NAD-dependent epimerase/dehydratase family protein [Saprospiraceae bacterium]MBK8855517.1 NAD-dependent epimerase/dehydratase family protein [Saprospiraceae bacterium]